MRKDLTIFLVVLVCIGLVVAAEPNPGHWADEIGNGTFRGDTAGAGTYVYERPIVSNNRLLIGAGTALSVAGFIDNPFGYVLFPTGIDVPAGNDICLGGVCRATWPGAGAGYWDKVGTSVYPAVLTDNVGIATNNPQVPLHVAGSMRLDTAALRDCNVGEALKTDAQGNIICAVDESLPAGSDADWTISGVDVYHQVGNVGIGNNNPQDALHVTGDVRLDNLAGCTSGNLKKLVVDGNQRIVCADDLSGGSGGGWVDDGVNIRLQTGTDRVGIGLLNPTEKLEVAGNIRLSGGINAPTGTICDQNGCIGGATVTPGWEEQGNDVRLRELTDNVAIGKATATEKLDVQGNILASGTICDTSGNCVTGGSGGGAWIENGALVYLKDATDSVGIGTVNPQEKVHVSGAGNTIRVESLANCNVGQALKTDASGTIVCAADEGGVAADGDWTISGSNIYRMIGNVGIGVMAPAEKLDVVGNIKATGTICDGGGSCLGGAPILPGWQDNGPTVTLSTITDRVGIGVNNPVESLQVDNGNIRISNLAGCTDASGNSLHTDAQGNIICDADDTAAPGANCGDGSVDCQFDSDDVFTGDLTVQGSRINLNSGVNTEIYNDGVRTMGFVQGTDSVYYLGDVYINGQTAVADIWAWNLDATFDVIANRDMYAGDRVMAPWICNDDGTDCINISNLGSAVGISGSGNQNRMAKFLDATTIGNSNVYEVGGRVGIGDPTPSQALEVSGNILASGTICDTGGNCIGAGGPGGVDGSGTLNRIPKFSAATTVADSIMSESAGTINVGGNVQATGTVCDSVGCIGAGGGDITGIGTANRVSMFNAAKNIVNSVITQTPTGILVAGNITATGNICNATDCVGGTGGSGIGGGGAVGYIPTFTTANDIGNSIIYQNGVNSIGFFTNTPTQSVDFNSDIQVRGVAGCAAGGGVLTTDAAGTITCVPDQVGPPGADSDWTINGFNVYHETGNVGIGNNNPQVPLHVSGNVRLDTAALRNCNTANGQGVLETDASGNIICGTDDGGAGSSPWQRVGTAVSLINVGDTVDVGNSLGLGAKLEISGALAASGNILSQTGDLMGDDVIANSNLDSQGVRIRGLPNCNNLGVLGTDASGYVYCDTDNTGSGTSLWTESGGNVYRTSGRVGIGTSAPTNTLDVNGNIRLRGVTSCTGASALETDASGNIVCGADAGGSSAWTVSGSDVYRSSGNVGIGTTTPATALHVAGDVRGGAAGGALRINTGNGWVDIGPQNTGYAHLTTDRSRWYMDHQLFVAGSINSYSTGNLQLGTGGTVRITADSTTGNVGIGTATPAHRLDVNDNIRAGGDVIVQGAIRNDAGDVVIQLG